MNTLYLEKRGMDFYTDEMKSASNVGNYRVTTGSECIKGKDGKTYYLDFNQGRKCYYRTTHKVTGRPLKHPVLEVVNEHNLHIDSQYTSGKYSFRNVELEQKVWDAVMDFTLENILKVVNDISIEQFDRIEIVNRVYPKVIYRNSEPEYIARFIRTDKGIDGEEIPIYRFPGGESMMTEEEIFNENVITIVEW